MSENQTTPSMPTTYDPKAAEMKWYDFWMDGKFLKRASAQRPRPIRSLFPAECNGSFAHWACARFHLAGYSHSL